MHIRYKLVFTVPAKYAQACKDAIFDVGGGVVGKYERVAFSTMGKGQFMPSRGAKPHTGKIGHVEWSEEERIEVTCSEYCIKQAVDALKNKHPYEEVAYEVFRIEDF